MGEASTSCRHVHVAFSFIKAIKYKQKWKCAFKIVTMSRLAFDGIPLSFHSGLHKVFLQCFLCYNLPVTAVWNCYFYILMHQWGSWDYCFIQILFYSEVCLGHYFSLRCYNRRASLLFDLFNGIVRYINHKHAGLLPPKADHHRQLRSKRKFNVPVCKREHLKKIFYC